MKKNSSRDTPWSALDGFVPDPPSAKPARPAAEEAVPAEAAAAGTPADMFSAMLGGKRAQGYSGPKDRVRAKNAADRAEEEIARRERAAETMEALAEELDRQAAAADEAGRRAAEAEAAAAESAKRAEESARDAAAARAAAESLRAENASLADRLAAAEKRAGEIEAGLAAAKERIESGEETAALRFRADFLERELERASRMPVQALLRAIGADAVREIFPGEVYCHVREALAGALDAAVAGGRLRRAEILEAVLAANPDDGRLAGLRERTSLAVKRAGGSPGRQSLAEFEKIGFKVVEGSKHYKLRWGRGHATIPKTGSDGAHGTGNTAADLNNTAF